MIKYVVSIDQSTASSKLYLVDRAGEIVRSVSLPHRQAYPAPGWAEHDAEEIWRNVSAGLIQVLHGISADEVAAIAVCNQRETTVLWNRSTGRPLAPAIVWQDVRAEGLCRELSASSGRVLQVTGLALSPYYTAAKAAHALRGGLARRAGDICVGTIDSWLIWNLSGHRVFATESPTRAARN